MEHEGESCLAWCGSDGAYVFRCTTGTLTAAERVREYPETRERLAAGLIHVTQERLLLDGGYVIPPSSAPAMPDALERHLCAWLAVPNGTYLVTAHYLAGPEDEELWGGAAPEDDLDEEGLPNIVLTFDRVSPP